MGKKFSEPRASGAHVDAYRRMNYLAQISMYAQSLSTSSGQHNVPSFCAMSRFYSTDMKIIAKRQVLRIEKPSKRAICQNCNLIMTPGLTSIYRIVEHEQPKQAPWLSIRCKICAHERKILCAPKDRSDDTPK